MVAAGGSQSLLELRGCGNRGAEQSSGDGQSASTLQPADEAAAAEAADDSVDLAKRLWSKNELIKQLKHVVQAQHSKIEELREELEILRTGSDRPFTALLHEEASATRRNQEMQELRHTVAQLSRDMASLKKENTTLQRANKRLKGMLQQAGSASAAPVSFVAEPPLGSVSVLASPQSCKQGVATSLPDEDLGLTATDGFSLAGMSRPTTTVTVTPRSARRPGNSPPKALPSCAKQRLVSSIPLFWRDLTSSMKILSSLFDVAERILSHDGTHAVLTIYVVDEWLKASCKKAKESSEPLMQYTVDNGKTTILALQYRKDKRTEVPIFTEVMSLPIQTASSMALAVHTPGTHRRIAALQATCVQDVGQSSAAFSNTDSGLMPKVLIKTGLAKEGDPESQARSSSRRSFTDWHRATLQLACHVLGGVLEQHEVRVQQGEGFYQLQGCVEVAVALTKAPSLREFELQTTTLLANFFGVSRARVFFYSPESEELFITSPTLRRKGFYRASINEGIVGLCARRRQPVHVSDTLHHPYFSSIVDLQQASSEKRLKKNTAMLCAPLMLGTERGDGALLGIVQLLEKPRRNGSQSHDFSEEEEALFENLLQICSHVLWRLFKVEEAAAKMSGQPSDMEQLLLG
mmetsp:Transcript_21671/g.50665  ORF Transcript_21671/g.50665 Transcript_21671/m.50665 type:complete len:635 (+) Transcript_21671:65-1969(+)